MIQRRVASLWLVTLLFCLAFVAACGANSRTRVLRVNLVILNAERDVVLVISKEREKQLYDSCNPPTCAKEEGYARVAAWQKKVDAAIKALDVAYRAIHDAALLNDAKSESEAREAFAKALALVKELKEKP